MRYRTATASSKEHTTRYAKSKSRKLDCDNWDNGTYIIKDWKIIDRLYQRRREQDVYPLMDMLLSIDEKQPNPLGEDAIKTVLEKIKQEENNHETL